MSDHQRDFYRIQDRLLMAWRHADIEPKSEYESALRSINRAIEDELLELNDERPEVAKALTLLNRKIELLTAAPNKTAESSSNLGGFCDKAYVDVSLSGTGMGYFSLTNADEGSAVEVILNLESIEVEIVVRMIIIESRVSADAENPGYWLRGRFLEGQEKQIDAVVAHVNQRQFEQLQRRSQAGAGNKDTED
jgi:hypothetical protein